MATARAPGRWLDGRLPLVGGALVYVVATVHFFHPSLGFPRLAVLVATGKTPLLVHDPRPLAFVLSGLALVAGIRLAMGADRRWLYAAGFALVATFFVGYFAWHLSGHGGFLPGREPLYHGMTPVEAVVTHLASSPVAALSKLAEAALLVVLAGLYREPAGAD